MTKTTQSITRRALIVSHGSIAEKVARDLEKRRHSPGAPDAVIGIVSGSSDDLNTALSTAVHNISRTNIQSDLATNNWTLNRLDDLFLVLLCDVRNTPASWPIEMQKIVAAQVDQKLGASIITLLIWLAPEGYTDTLRISLHTCETKSESFPMGILVQGIVTADGLCLENEQALVSVMDLAVWILLTTPLQQLPEIIMTAQMHEPAFLHFGTLGASAWQWYPERVLPVLAQRIKQHILQQWQQPSVLETHPETVASWLAGMALTPDTLLIQAGKVSLPVMDMNWGVSWQVPKPWCLQKTWSTMQAAADLDRVALQPFLNRQQYPLLEVVGEAKRHLYQHLNALLDANPTAGLDIARTWLTVADRLCDEWVGHLYMQQEQLEITGSQLAAERGLLHAAWQKHMNVWPAARWQEWKRALFRPWYWPILLWRYRQLCQTGQQTQRLLNRQGELNRQLARLQWVIQVVSELQRMFREAWGVVDEAAAMIGHVCRSCSWADADLAVEETVILEYLFEQILTNMQDIVAETAAAAGTLGSYLNDPDDIRLQTKLDEHVHNLTAPFASTPALSLLRQIYTHSDTWERWWQAFWKAASPLWRYDITKIPEEARSNQKMYACICAAGVTKQAIPIVSDTEGQAAVMVFDMVDTRQIYLMRWHSHLSATAILREENTNGYS